MNRRLIAVLTSVLALGCKIEPLEDPEDIAPSDPPWRLAALPELALGGDEADPNTLWETSIRKHLSFLSGADLQGRRPGTDGGRVTAAAAEALFADAGLIPSAADFGWTSPVPLRVVETKNTRLVFKDPASDAPTPITIDDGLYLHHRGAPGEFTISLAPVELSSGLPLAQKLGYGRLRDTRAGDTLEDPVARIRAVFDAAAHRGASACLLALPPDDQAALRVTAQAWAAPDVQLIPLGSTLPASLAIEGFATGPAFEALQRAASVPGASVDVHFEATERWFEDANVLGRIVGKRRPEQVVIVTAAWDAGGLTPPLESGGDPLAATGAAALFAIAQRTGLLVGSGRRPDRSIVFVATAQGSLDDQGLARLADEDIALPENIVALVNLERLDWTAPALTVIGGADWSLGSLFSELLPSVELAEDTSGYGHNAFDNAGVPRVTVTRRGGSGAESLDPSSPLANLAVGVRVTFDVVWELANTTEFPVRVEPKPEPAPPEVEVVQPD